MFIIVVVVAIEKMIHITLECRLHSSPNHLSKDIQHNFLLPYFEDRQLSHYSLLRISMEGSSIVPAFKNVDWLWMREICAKKQT
mmetsp:Transcript_9773/g.17858  ORF Transcript_9773/g.17858 Transcript_9773/m.17858 type:complete len:84 (-) Transcript_9773:91-342(-)